jgi:hypothetical protein
MALDRKPRTSRIALDRASVRSIDRDGRLHIAVSNICKEGVDLYVGEEIPGFKELGLDPARVYRLYRPGAELEKAVASFNNQPILREHIPVSAEEPQQELVIGSTGTTAVFEDGFIRNSSVIWVQDDIDDIESEEKRDWSPGYYYTAVMKPGKFNGLQYDGMMCDITCNHVALVDEGRQGRDVVVGDRQPGNIKMVLNSRRALLLHGAIAALVAPKLAMDSKVNLSGAFGKVNAKTRGKDAKTIAAAVVKIASPKLAQDEALEVADVVAIINAVDGNGDTSPAIDEDEIPEPGPEDDGMVNDGDDALSKVMAFLEGKLSDEDMAALGELVSGENDGGQAVDEEPEDEPGNPPREKDKPAMDANAIRRSVMREQTAIREAERAVAPHIGEVTVAMDSAAAIYKLALDAANVDLTGVPASAYKAMVGMLTKPDDAAPRIGMDSRTAATKSFAARFPEAGRLIPS